MSISLAGPHSRKVRIHGKGGAIHKSPAIEQVGAESECLSGGSDRCSEAAGGRAVLKLTKAGIGELSKMCMWKIREWLPGPRGRCSPD